VVVGALQVELGESAKLTIHFDGGLIKRACLTAHGSDADVASLRDADEHPAAYRQRANGSAEPGSATSGDEPIEVGVVPVPDIALLAKRHVPVLAVHGSLPPDDLPARLDGVRASSISQVRARYSTMRSVAGSTSLAMTVSRWLSLRVSGGLTPNFALKACSNASPAPARAAPRRRRPP
jgi:hypothetical protein